MTRNKKGISPLIATILIIGFTIVLAALVMQWGTQLLKTQTEQTAMTSKAQIACSTEVDFNVDSAKLGTLDSVTGVQNIDVRVTNNRDRTLTGFRVRISSGESVFTKTITTSIPGFGSALLSGLSFNAAAPATPIDVTPNKVEVIPEITIDGNKVACPDQRIEKTVEAPPTP